MIIKYVKLVNFRNHSEYFLDCNRETSLILGKNGCGKTSVLEAIYILTQGKSFRAVDGEILKRGTEFYRVEMEYCNGEKITAVYDGKNKNFVILDKKFRRLPRKNRYPVVLFLPSDLHLVGSSPSRRRDYFDRIFGQFDENYGNILNSYNKALKQRNEALKSQYVAMEVLFPWNLLLAQYGAKICAWREKYITDINRSFTEVYRSIAKNEDEVEIRLKSEVLGMSEAQYLTQLEGDLQRDIYLGHTGFGIHKDDFMFYFNGKEADGSASRGETRSMILAMKFIEADIIFEKTRKKPIVLLDDVFSELDEERRRCLVENFKKNQVIITSVESF